MSFSAGARHSSEVKIALCGDVLRREGALPSPGWCLLVVATCRGYSSLACRTLALVILPRQVGPGIGLLGWLLPQSFRS